MLRGETGPASSPDGDDAGDDAGGAGDGAGARAGAGAGAGAEAGDGGGAGGGARAGYGDGEAGRRWWADLLVRVAAGEARLVVGTPDGAEAVLVGRAWLERLELRSAAAAASAVRLSSREVEVLELVDRGLTATAVAGRLGIAVNTVHQHLTMVRRKFGVRVTGEAILAARAAGLLTDGVPRPRVAADGAASPGPAADG